MKVSHHLFSDRRRCELGPSPLRNQELKTVSKSITVGLATSSLYLLEKSRLLPLRLSLLTYTARELILTISTLPSTLANTFQIDRRHCFKQALRNFTVLTMMLTLNCPALEVFPCQRSLSHQRLLSSLNYCGNCWVDGSQLPMASLWDFPDPSGQRMNLKAFMMFLYLF